MGGKSAADSARTPVEAPDTLRSIAYAEIVDLLSEGEIEGLEGGLQGIAYSETVLQNADESFNFKNVTVDFRSGTQDQEPLPGEPVVASETGVGVELEEGTPWIHAFVNLNLTGLRVRLSVNALSKVDPENGDTNGHYINYAIDLSTDGGAYIEIFNGAFSGKASSTYERSHTIDLPEATDTGWLLRVRRITPNSTSQYIQDDTNIVSFTELIHANLRYVNSAVVRTKIDASQFNSIPSRAFYGKWRKIRIPSNYDPITLIYTGAWDGTFQVAWTCNPAWIYYDMATHPRYGLGRFVDESRVDKWSLYAIAQYCDELVDDGKGGMEPRFACHVYFQARADAYKVLQDLASVFRGIAYWAGGMIVTNCDMPGDPVYTYTNANIVGGKFNYQGTSRKARHSVALVQWSDPQDFGRGKIEYVPDEESIARYGIRPLNITGIGCQSQGQAHRMGKWALFSEKLETQTVTFPVALDGVIALPGQDILIADEKRAGERTGGRISASTTTVITVDAMPTVDPGDTLTVILPSGLAQTRPVTAKNAPLKTITVSPAFDAAPVVGAAWVVQRTELEAQLFRVISVGEQDGIIFNITGLQKNASKFGAVEENLAIQVPDISNNPSRVSVAPTTITLSSYEKIQANLPNVVLVVEWDMPDGALSYNVSVKCDQGDWTPAAVVLTGRWELENAAPGSYVARVQSVGFGGITSPQRLSDPFVLGTAVYRDPVIVGPPLVGVVTIDTAISEQFNIDVTANISIAFANDGVNRTFIVDIYNTGAFTVALPGNVTAIAPATAYTATPSGHDRLAFQSIDGGTTYTLRYNKDLP